MALLTSVNSVPWQNFSDKSTDVHASCEPNHTPFGGESLCVQNLRAIPEIWIGLPKFKTDHVM